MAREYRDSGIEWIGQIPKEWETAAIKRLMCLYAGATPKSDDVELWNGNIPWITPADYKTEDVFISRGRRSISEKGLQSCATTILPVNSLVFSKRAPIGLVVLNSVPLCTNQGCIGCVPKDSTTLSKYYYYVLSAFTEQFELYGAGTTFKEISATNFANFIVCMPPFSTQQKIADYLDKVCGEVDEMVALQETMIEELKAYKQSVITEAVTKGLNPNVPMRNISIDWVGEIPEHWEVRRIGRLFRLRDEKNYKPMEEVQLLSLYTGIGVFPHGEQEERGNKAVTVEGYKVVHKDDIVVNIILAWMGAIGVSDYDGVTSPAYDVYIPDFTKVVPHYFHYVFRTKGIAAECYKYGRGIMMMRWRTYSSEFKQISVPYPSIEEQHKIASYLDTKCSEIDSLIALKQAKIEELKEYKKSIIYEYATGKKEVV